MAVKLGDAFVALTTKDELDKGLNSGRARVNDWVRDVSQGIAQGIGQALANAIGNGIRAGFAGVASSIKAASDLNETIAKTSAVFRDSSRDILEWSKTTSTAFGLTQQGALDSAASLGNMFKQLGGGTSDAATFSKDMVTLAGDLTAFHNVAGGTSEVLDDMASAFRGEFDPIQKYIPVINAAVVEQRALADTGKETAKSLTALDKAMAVQALIVQGMGDAYGSAAREIDSAASQQRIFEARITESAATLGQVFLPVQQAFFKGLNELIDIVAPYGENIMRSLAGGLARGIVAVLPVLAELRGVFVRLLKAQSPPKLLPELTEWGKSAMQEYLRGWTQADFGALTELGGTFERIIRSFASSGDIAETDLVSRVFGTQQALTNAIREFRQLGFVSEATLGGIADAAGPAGTEIAGLVREYFELQRATQQVSDAQDELNAITQTYADALNPLQDELDAVRSKQQEIRENQELEDLGEVLTDPRADADARQLARLKIQEIQLERQARAIEDERDVAVDSAQAKIDFAKKEEAAQQSKYAIAQSALDQQTKTNALIAEETTLRQRLIDEGIAEQARVLRELEAAQREAEATERERVAGIDAITEAQFRMKFATSDTAGQLELWQEKLRNAEKGSVEFYDAVTQVWLLTKKLNDEMALLPPGGGGAAEEVNKTIDGITEKWPEIVQMEEAIKQFFATIAGQDNEVTELTWGQGILDFFTEAGRLANEAKPLVQGFIDLIMGKKVEGGEGADPFGDNWWLAGAVPGINNIIKNLGLIRDGDWAGLWAGFKQYVDDVLNNTAGEEDGTTFGLYTWLRDTAIPLLESLATVEWAALWNSFETAVHGAWEGIVDFIDARIAEIVSAVAEVRRLWESLPGQGGGTPSSPGAPKGPAGQDVLPPSNFSSFPGVLPNTLLPALASSNMTNSGNTVVQINQTIGTNGDFGGARAGAQEGIRQALINGRLT